ncbi:hypothetical protein [Vibrio parahaemolyticus]|uniref:hypothetical protein n=1 Tax=Vibrio parahaemolyticus TaxID=670 RepID=UPI003891A535
MFVNYYGETYCIRNAEADYMVLQHTLNHKCEMISTDAWSSAYCDGALTITQQEKQVAIHPITDSKKLAEAERMLAYLNELEVTGKFGSEATRRHVINYISEKIQDPTPPNHMQLYRLYKRWERAGKNIQVLLSTKQSRTKPVTDAQMDFAMYIIDEHFLVPHGDNRSELYRIFKAEFYLDTNQQQFKLSGKPMSKSALDNILDTLDPFEVFAAQNGIDAARSKFRDSNEKIETFFPGERVEIDAVHLNLGVLDDATDTYIGKVILFLAIDVHTRYILGYSIVYGTNPAESAEAVINLLRHVVSPKKRNGNYSNDWQSIGVPYCIHADNGPGFIAEMTLRFCAMLNTDLHRSESRKSQRRPFIERFNRTLRGQLMTKIPGYLGKRMEEKDFNKTIEQAAVVRLSEFTRYLEEFIVDVYHQNPHKGLEGMTPAQMLEQCRDTFYPRPVPNIAEMNALVGVTYTRTIQATQGIQIKNLYYNSTELKNLRFKLMKNRKSKGPQKVEFIFNPQDISSITVLEPDSMKMLVVPLRNKTVLPGTTLAEHQAQKLAKKGTFVQQEHKSFSSKHKQHRKSNKAHKAKSSDIKIPKSNVVTHPDYDPQKVIEEGTARLAQDDTQRTQTTSSDAAPSQSEHKPSLGRKRSRGR